MTTPTLDKSLIGAAGVHFVVSELSLRGLIALPTIRNTAGIDVIATNQDATWHANLQVKTSRARVGFWPIGTKHGSWQGPNCYCVFVRYLKAEKRFEAFVETASRVSAVADAVMKDARERGLKDWAPWWPIPKGEEDRVRDQWLQFGPWSGLSDEA